MNTITYKELHLDGISKGIVLFAFPHDLPAGSEMPHRLDLFFTQEAGNELQSYAYATPEERDQEYEKLDTRPNVRKCYVKEAKLFRMEEENAGTTAIAFKYNFKPKDGTIQHRVEWLYLFPDGTEGSLAHTFKGIPTLHKAFDSVSMEHAKGILLEHLSMMEYARQQTANTKKEIAEQEKVGKN